MNRVTSLALSGSLLLGAFALTSLAGCGMFPHANGPAEPIEFSIQPSARSVVAGEVVTVTTRSANAIGRNTAVDWAATGGDLTTEQNKRIARVRFDQPGTYTVSAVLRVDNNVAMSDAVDITVKPLQH